MSKQEATVSSVDRRFGPLLSCVATVTRAAAYAVFPRTTIGGQP